MSSFRCNSLKIQRANCEFVYKCLSSELFANMSWRQRALDVLGVCSTHTRQSQCFQPVSSEECAAVQSESLSNVSKCHPGGRMRKANKKERKEEWNKDGKKETDDVQTDWKRQTNKKKQINDWKGRQKKTERRQKGDINSARENWKYKQDGQTEKEGGGRVPYIGITIYGWVGGR